MSTNTPQTVTCTFTSLHTADLIYAVPEGTGWARRETTVSASDPWQAAERLLADQGLRLRAEWRIDPDHPATCQSSVTVVEPVPWGPELLHRTEAHRADLTTVVNALGPRRRIDTAPLSEAHQRLVPLLDWFATAVEAHPWWPWTAVDGQDIATRAAQAALAHPREAVRRSCYTRMHPAKDLGQADQEAWAVLGYSAYDERF